MPTMIITERAAAIARRTKEDLVGTLAVAGRLDQLLSPGDRLIVLDLQT